MARSQKVMKTRAAAKKFTFKFETGKTAIIPKGKYYPSEDIVFTKGPVPVRNPPKIRASIKPGCVLIMLAGRFRGKRVVCLKILKSGLLLVTGPYSVNGVPLRRVNQRYAIATSTFVPLDGIDVATIEDDFFKRDKVKKTKKTTEEQFFTTEPQPTVTSPERKAAQVKVDGQLVKNIAKVDMLEAYLKSKFSLSKADRPHAMKF
eukprot:CAMPEP_0182427530 /NCGR_PEP_ID=MMETSP1167-20130531/18172_1 /TAXON_ID=2988 /ORGANISM="Mallomonas Sp, Strain CCMP3275" /LENGTH=203 /DNA_ID=CAMNT_0024609835 /DNA_START=26 /DNA_END=637 /DNA_ORIENTATION=+